MPEAPEVQTIINTLIPEIEGREIVGCKITHPKLIENITPHEFEKEIVGQHFRHFYRRGKYMDFEMDDYDFIAHMRMEGKLFVYDRLPDDPKITKHIHAVFKLDNGKLLAYQDTRKFGRMDLFKKEEDKDKLPIYKKIGPDVLDEKFNREYLFNKIHKRKLPIKSLLLDQSVVAGIGNIYADEILFEAGLDPRNIGTVLDEADCDKIVKAAKAIISEAMEFKGTTIRTFEYGKDHAGSYQEKLKVHGKLNELCQKCHGEIIKIEVGQRSTYLCPNCQKRK